VGTAALAKKNAELIKRYNRADITIVGSFNHRTIENFRKQARLLGLDLLTCASNAEIAALMVDNTLRLGSRVAVEAPPSRARIPILCESFIKAAHAAGRPVVVWTIDDPQEMDKMLKMGVDGIISNHPARAAAAVRNFKP
jgi:glycerophosphoryl diester phosphodiesterase